MADCLFCQIVAGKVPNYTVYEDEHTLAFLDIYPTVEGFTVVIPKQHSDYIWDMEDTDYQPLMNTVKKVGQRLQEVFQPKKIGVHVEGLHIKHTHVKVFPFSSGAEFHALPNMSREPDSQALTAMAERLRF